MVSDSSIGGSKFPYDLFGCKLCFRLGRVVIWRHRAMHRVAPDGTSSRCLANKGRSPVPRFALVGNNRKLRYVGHVASDGIPRASYAGMSTAAPLPRALDRRGRRSEEHTSELQSLAYLVCRLLLEKKKKNPIPPCSAENRQ